MEEAKNQLMLQATPTPLESTDRSIHDHQLYSGTGYNGLTPATGLPGIFLFNYLIISNPFNSIHTWYSWSIQSFSEDADECGSFTDS